MTLLSALKLYRNSNKNTLKLYRNRNKNTILMIRQLKLIKNKFINIFHKYYKIYVLYDMDEKVNIFFSIDNDGVNLLTNKKLFGSK
jgi:hypothetical protein